MRVAPGNQVGVMRGISRHATRDMTILLSDGEIHG
jgi:hypothetical protein